MTRSGSFKPAPGYDIFKSIVAIILMIILIILLLRNRQGASMTLATPSETLSPPLETPTRLPSETPSPTLTPTETNLPTFTATFEPTSTMTPNPTLETATPEGNQCPSIASRIQLGDIVVVRYRLNLRAGPGLSWSIILTNNPNTKLTVIGGPTCTTVKTAMGETRAHLWWHVRMENGTEGWSAEGQLLQAGYFLLPVR